MRLLYSLTQVSGMTLLSRVLGFCRDVMIASVFGAQMEADAFIVAFKIPNLMRRLFADGAFQQSFTPVLSAEQAKDKAGAQQLINRVFTALMSLLLLITVLGMSFSDGLMGLFAPGFRADPEKIALASGLLQVTFPYILLISGTAFMAGVLNSFHHYWRPAFAPTLLNVSFIMASLLAWYFSPPSIWWLAYAAVVGGFAQLIFLSTAVRGLGAWPTLDFHWRDPKVKKVAFLMGPALLAASIYQINSLVDSMFASFLIDGAVSWIYYSERLLEFPLGIIGVGISTVIMPYLAKFNAKGDKAGLDRTTQWALFLNVALVLPACVGLWVLSVPIIDTLFQRGAFTAHDVIQTAAALCAFSLGIVAFSVYRILISVFFAKQSPRVPLYFSCLSFVVNVVGNACLVGPYGHVGLILASITAAWVQCLGMYWYLVKRQHISAPVSHVYARLLVASGVMGGVLWLIQPYFWQMVSDNFSSKVFYLSILLLIGVLSYVVSLFLLGFRQRHFILSE